MNKLRIITNQNTLIQNDNTIYNYDKHLQIISFVTTNNLSKFKKTH